ncbi:hypothetical protein [Alteromonas sp. 5E99-2]|uniref:hypothetical protein n=1 Tax=Alteromonas sp. 5E99-2 TaxID=2817683 RepID=UPI00325B96D7
MIIIVVLVGVLFVTAIILNAVQQHRAKAEAEKRTEIAKFKAIIDETENAISVCSQFPIQQKLVVLLHNRVLFALENIISLSPATADLKQRLKDKEAMIKSMDANSSELLGEFGLPDNDKQVIQYIQGVKKLRVLLRAEHSKGKVEPKVFIEQDKQLERLQLRVNVETLGRRAASAMSAKMLGSARQYFEKGIKAMENQSKLDEILAKRLMQFKQQLAEIQDELKNANAEDRERKKEEDRDELDELFAPKKKW